MTNEWTEADVAKANASYDAWIDSIAERLAEGIQAGRYPHLVAAIKYAAAPNAWHPNKKAIVS
jgi:hypothetical protein